MEVLTFNVIEIAWDGPFLVDDVITNKRGGSDYGIYQIYGTHNIFGPNSLLYIGMSQWRRFGARFREHRDSWTAWEPSEVKVYLGRLGSTREATKTRARVWQADIAHAEALLIYFCAPPYNGALLKELSREIPPTVVLNHRRRHRLPFEVSTMIRDTRVDEKEDWGEYRNEVRDSTSAEGRT